MYFSYNLKYINFDNEMISEWGLLQADTYVEAIKILDQHYDEHNIDEILYLAPFTDNSVVVLDEAALAHIRSNEHNTF